MEATIKSMKLEVIVKSNGEIICYDKVEKNKGSSKKFKEENAKKIRVPMGNGGKRDKSDDKKPKPESIFSKNENSFEKLQKTKPIAESIKTVDEKNKSADDKSKGEPKGKSFFSKLLSCCRKEKPKTTNKEVLPSSEHLTIPEVKMEQSDEISLSLEKLEASQINAEPSEVFYSSDGPDSEVSMADQSKNSYKPDETLDHYEVIPLRSASDHHQSDNEQAESHGEYSDEPTSLPNEADIVSNHMNLTPLNDGSPDEKSAENKGNNDTYITDIYFEAVVSLSSN